MIFDPMTIFRKQGISFTIRQLEAIVNTYDTMVRRIENLRDYKLFLEESGNTLEIIYIDMNKHSRKKILNNAFRYEIDKSTGNVLFSFEERLDILSGDKFDTRTMFRQHGIALSIQQVEAIVTTYRDVLQRIDDLSEYELIIEDGRRKLYVHYVHVNIYKQTRELISDDVVSYEILKLTGRILRFYYGIR
jgi:hypothetical protein